MCESFQIDIGVLQKSPATVVTRQDVWSIGQPTQRCVFCGANMWMHERLAKRGANNTILFAICCMSGKVTLPLLPVPPPLLGTLLDGDDERALHHQKHIRAFNGMFSFTSMAGKI
ncbi:hypothetical protein Ahy_B03g064041 [Arachis hypogaea]|uniref:Uncharacterized protein n=1 Tax=Arachis hypogaea TaxID=3818 RepID=A0A444ZYP4_ARAHY|nr:hypothetical protein Ahy_B03g064041 [Arachis hypogaea]